VISTKTGETTLKTIYIYCVCVSSSNEHLDSVQGREFLEKVSDSALCSYLADDANDSICR
jgi:hypothetical protein